jgi:hypothetical protein
MNKLLVALALALLSAPALAQTVATDETFNVTITAPDGWAESETEERVVFAFRHEDHSQIEVLGVELMTPEVADVFFTFFHDTLQSSDFMQVGREDKAYGERNGTETVYRFEHSGVALKVVTFQFANDTTAWIFVGYMQEELFDGRVADFQAAVESFAFGE